MSIQKITEQEVRSLWVQRLSDTPNRAGRYGTPGLTAAEVKAAYDALSLRIVEAYNTLVDAIESGKLTESIPALADRTLHEVLSDIRNGNFAAYLSVDGLRTLSRLAAEFDTHDHPAYAPLAGNEDQPFAVGEPTGGADALSRDFADGRYFSNLSAEYDPESGRLQFSAERVGAPVSAEITLPTEKGLLRQCDKRFESLSASLTNLRESALGLTFETVTAVGTGDEYVFEEGALPVAQLKRLGGYASHTPSADFWFKAPDGFTVVDAEGNITQNEAEALAPVKRLFPDFAYGISPSLCNYYDFESGLYHRCVKAESYPTPLFGSGLIYLSPVLSKETDTFYIFNVQIGEKKPIRPLDEQGTPLFCSAIFKATTVADLSYGHDKNPLVTLYGEGSSYRCLKFRVPKENDMGITADPQTLTDFFADKTISLLLPFEEEIFSLEEALREEGSEQTLPDGLISIVPNGKAVFGQNGYTVCYELEYDKKTKGDAV